MGWEGEGEGNLWRMEASSRAKKQVRAAAPKPGGPMFIPRPDGSGLHVGWRSSDAKRWGSVAPSDGGHPISDWWHFGDMLASRAIWWMDWISVPGFISDDIPTALLLCIWFQDI
jgi:hypothetical protein